MNKNNDQRLIQRREITTFLEISADRQKFALGYCSFIGSDFLFEKLLLCCIEKSPYLETNS